MLFFTPASLPLYTVVKNVFMICRLPGAPTIQCRETKSHTLGMFAVLLSILLDVTPVSPGLNCQKHGKT